MTTALIRRLADGDNSPDVFQWMAQAAKKYLRGETIDTALGLDRSSLLRERNAALYRAADLLDRGGGPWCTAGLLAASIKRFENRMLQLYRRGLAEPSPVDQALIDAFATGQRIPKTQRKLYDILR